MWCQGRNPRIQSTSVCFVIIVHLLPDRSWIELRQAPATLARVCHVVKPPRRNTLECNATQSCPVTGRCLRDHTQLDWLFESSVDRHCQIQRSSLFCAAWTQMTSRSKLWKRGPITTHSAIFPTRSIRTTHTGFLHSVSGNIADGLKNTIHHCGTAATSDTSHGETDVSWEESPGLWTRRSNPVGSPTPHFSASSNLWTIRKWPAP